MVGTSGKRWFCCITPSASLMSDPIAILKGVSGPRTCRLTDVQETFAPFAAHERRCSMADDLR